MAVPFTGFYESSIKYCLCEKIKRNLKFYGKKHFGLKEKKFTVFQKI